MRDHRVYKHTNITWVRLYIERWLVAPMQMEDGDLKTWQMGTPQGGVISPVLANLFLHYVYDKWLQKHFPKTLWCRYADDGLVHCNTESEAQQMLEALKARFEDCGLELHPTKTKIVYCKDGSRKGDSEHTSFDFLGYTFMRRVCKNWKRNSLFLSFSSAVSKSALKSMRLKIRKLRVRMKTELSIAQMAKWLNPMINGWINYYGRYYRSVLYGMCRHVNKALVRWARRKFKPLRRHKTQAMRFLERISEQNPHLFAHWKQGM